MGVDKQDIPPYYKFKEFIYTRHVDGLKSPSVDMLNGIVENLQRMPFDQPTWEIAFQTQHSSVKLQIEDPENENIFIAYGRRKLSGDFQ